MQKIFECPIGARLYRQLFVDVALVSAYAPNLLLREMAALRLKEGLAQGKPG